MTTTEKKRPLTKAQVIKAVGDACGLDKKQVTSMFIALEELIDKELNKRGGPGVIIPLPGLFKIRKVRKPARKAQKNVPNPFKPGELRDIPAKPAYDVVRVTCLKKIKDMVKPKTQT